MNFLSRYITLLLLALLPAVGLTQSKPPKTGNTKQQMKRLEKVEKQKQKDQEKAEKELIKQHTKNQDKETQKRMKKTKKKSKRHKNGQYQEPFFKRLFRKK